jgi:hypothetical protein
MTGIIDLNELLKLMTPEIQSGECAEKADEALSALKELSATEN